MALSQFSSAVWFDANDVNGDSSQLALNTKIGSWKDKSGNDNHISQSTDSLKPEVK